MQLFFTRIKERRAFFLGPTKTNVSCCLVCLYYMLLLMPLYCFCFPIHIDKYNNNNNNTYRGSFGRIGQIVICFVIHSLQWSMGSDYNNPKSVLVCYEPLGDTKQVPKATRVDFAGFHMPRLMLACRLGATSVPHLVSTSIRSCTRFSLLRDNRGHVIVSWFTIQSRRHLVCFLIPRPEPVGFSRGRFR